VSLIISITVISISAEESLIPSWIKNNAKWWSEGQIGESDYISSLQYLISQGIIEIPITEVTAIEHSLSDSERAQSIVVSFSGGDYFTEEKTIYTYVTFFHYSPAVITGILPSQSVLGVIQPIFWLRSLPSVDKQIIYNLIDKYVNAGQKPQQFDVKVDILAGDGNLIQSWEYRKCDIFDYSTYIDSDKDEYRYGNIDQLEIRELLVIGCSGFSLKT